MIEHTLVWFRQDLRIRDNPALGAAARAGRPVIPLFIHAPAEECEWAPGEASNWWLFHALAELREELERIGLPLVLGQGRSLRVIEDIAASHDVTAVFWNRRYEPHAIDRDAAVAAKLRKSGLRVETFNASLAFEPDTVANRSGRPFQVFTPFWKHLRSLPLPGPVSVDVTGLNGPSAPVDSVPLERLGLLPDVGWDAEFYVHWRPGLEDAQQALHDFVASRIFAYRDQRDRPGAEATSRLSPYLHFGQLGPRQVWHAVQEADAVDHQGGFSFLGEMAWREFAYHLLFHFPQTPEEALRPAFRAFPWEPEARFLQAWQRGRTGYPIVDAGMRQLWRSGWMHNRIRMLAASFLVKHLLQPWQDGARWFWDTLVDADLASNTMNWQWVAGCGADAAPYFRIFNPMLQGERFDPGGDYVRRYVPELRDLPAKYIQQPWKAPAGVLEASGVRLGDNYPEPVIGHRAGRERALAALAANQANPASRG
jgi:deoxyribodipyrimidine photo-lyase